MTAPVPTWTEGWHFATVNAKGEPRERYGRRRLIVTGERLAVRGTPELCACGMHASERAIEALDFAIDSGHGIIATRVILDGRIAYQSDKAAASGRTVTAMLPAAETAAVLRAFARRCALDVLPLWRDSAPGIVVQYLETGDESIRDAARAAAWSAAGSAAWSAAGSAARAAARAAAGSAAWAAARDAARDAARAAAWSAARAAAGSAARAAAWDAARDAARAAKLNLYNEWLEAMLTEAMAKDAG